MMGLPPPDTGGCKPKLFVLMGDIIQTLNISPSSDRTNSYSCVPNKHIVPNKSIGWQIAQI